MTTITDFLVTVSNYIKTIGLADILDILIVAFLIYQLIRLIRRNNSMRVARGIVLLLVMLWLSGVLKLTMINYLLRRAVELGLIAILIIFQPELRRLLEKIGSSRFKGFFGGDFSTLHMENAITQAVLACADMSRSHTGALIVFERDNQLTDPISTGTLIDAEVTTELLKNIFFVKAPLHDGAVIMKDGRIAAAGCMLPVVLIVSEETGAISIAVDGMLKRHLSTETVETLLRKELLPAETNGGRKKGPLDFIRGKKA